MDISQPTVEDEILEFKVLITGEPSVGKTSLVARYTTGQFSQGYKSTIGVDFADKTVRWNDHLIVKLHLWDLAGQDRLNAQARAYYRETDGAICVCDVSRIKTKEQAWNWKDGIKERAVNKSGLPLDPPCALIVNKMDLYGKACEDKEAFFPPLVVTSGELLSNTEEIAIDADLLQVPSTEEEVKKWCKDLELRTYDMAQKAGFITGVPVCVSYNVGMDDAFKSLIAEMIRRRREQKDLDAADMGNRDDIINLRAPTAYEENPNQGGRCGGYC